MSAGEAPLTPAAQRIFAEEREGAVRRQGGHGSAPLPNKHNQGELGADDAALWSALVDHAVTYQFPINMPEAMRVQPDAEAEDLLDGFQLDCIAKLNATDDESERQVWSRAHVKVMKVAALLAVADHYLKPVVTVEHVRWV